VKKQDLNQETIRTPEFILGLMRIERQPWTASLGFTETSQGLYNQRISKWTRIFEAEPAGDPAHSIRSVAEPAGMMVGKDHRKMAERKCAHPQCNCEAKKGSNYCSDHCANASGSQGMQGSSCGCGHPHCTHR